MENSYFFVFLFLLFLHTTFCISWTKYVIKRNEWCTDHALIKALWRTHWWLDVQWTHILPMLFQKWDQEIDSQMNILCKFVCSHSHMSNGNTKAQNLQTNQLIVKWSWSNTSCPIAVILHNVTLHICVYCTYLFHLKFNCCFHFINFLKHGFLMGQKQRKLSSFIETRAQQAGNLLDQGFTGQKGVVWFGFKVKLNIN